NRTAWFGPSPKRDRESQVDWAAVIQPAFSAPGWLWWEPEVDLVPDCSHAGPFLRSMGTRPVTRVDQHLRPPSEEPQHPRCLQAKEFLTPVTARRRWGPMTPPIDVYRRRES